MLVPFGVFFDILEAMEKAGIKLGVRPVKTLAMNPELLEALKTRRKEVLKNVKRKNRKDAEQLLETLIASAEKIRAGLTGKEPTLRNLLLSYTVAVMRGWDMYNTLLRDVLKNLPEAYDTMINGKIYVVIMPTDEELNQKILTGLFREKVEDILLSYLRDPRIMKIDAENGKVEVAGTVLTITSFEPLVRLLYRTGRRKEATDKVFTVIKKILRMRAQSYVEEVRLQPPDDVTVVVRKTALSVPQEISDVVGRATITVKAKISYTDMKLYRAYGEIDSEFGVIRIPEPDKPISETDTLVRNAVQSISVFLSHDAPILWRATREAERLGFKFYRVGYHTVRGLDISFTKERQVPAGRAGKIEVVVRARKDWPITEKVEARIKVDTGSEAVKASVLGRLKELGLETEYSAYRLSVADTGKKSFTVTLFSTSLEDTAKLLEASDTIMKDIEIIMRQAATRQSQASAQKLSEENHLGLYVLLALANIKNVLEKASEYTGRTPTGIQRVLKTHLEKKGINIDTDTLANKPLKVVEVLMEKNMLGFTENLELTLEGKKLVELVKPVKALGRNHNIQVLTSIATEAAIRLYCALKRHSVVLELLNKGAVTLDTIIKHIEAGAPVELEILKHRLNGRTVWEQLPPNIKLRALKLLPVEQVVWLEKDASLPKTREDYELLMEAICNGSNPSRCTEYMVSTHPEYLGIPRTLRIVEHSEEKWIDAGMYRVQVEKITRGAAVFRVEEKTTGRILHTKAKTIKEAIYRATTNDIEETTTL